MIRKTEMEKIKDFCKENELVYLHEFISMKYTDNDMSRHLVTFKKGGQEVLNFEKRTSYDFEEDTMGVFWIITEEDDDQKYVDNLHAVLAYIERRLVNNVAKES